MNNVSYKKGSKYKVKYNKYRNETRKMMTNYSGHKECKFMLSGNSIYI